MGALLQTALAQGLFWLLLVFVFVPLLLYLLVCLIYILAASLREWRRSGRK